MTTGEAEENNGVEVCVRVRASVAAAVWINLIVGKKKKGRTSCQQAKTKSSTARRPSSSQKIEDGFCKNLTHFSVGGEKKLHIKAICFVTLPVPAFFF